MAKKPAGTCECCLRTVDQFFYTGSEVKWCVDCVMACPNDSVGGGYHNRMPMYLAPSAWSSAEISAYKSSQQSKYAP